MTARTMTWALTAILALGCNDDQTVEDGRRFGTEAEPAPALENDDGPRSSEARLLGVDELAASVSVAAGQDVHGEPITWQVDLGGGAMDGYSDGAFGRTLGRPDYVTVTEESGQPSTLYAKFARDMARAVCDRIIGQDLLRSSGFTLWPHVSPTSEPSDAAVTANLRYLMLRFWGQPADAGDPLLESLRRVYRTSRDGYQGGVTSPQIEGWRGVCIALFEDPTFHIH